MAVRLRHYKYTNETDFESNRNVIFENAENILDRKKHKLNVLSETK
jgi:hypothetical protein